MATIDQLNPESKGDVPTLCSAILAGVANGIWDSVEEAADQFVKVKEIYEPNKENQQIYQQVYEKYVEITKVLNPTFQS